MARKIKVLLGSIRYDSRDGGRGEIIAIRSQHVVMRMEPDSARRTVPNSSVARRYIPPATKGKKPAPKKKRSAPARRSRTRPRKQIPTTIEEGDMIDRSLLPGFEIRDELTGENRPITNAEMATWMTWRKRAGHGQLPRPKPGKYSDEEHNTDDAHLAKPPEWFHRPPKPPSAKA